MLQVYRCLYLQKATASVERDENYVPSTRSSLKAPSGATAHVSDYHDILEETPVYTVLRMMVMQLFGWQAYLWSVNPESSRFGNLIEPQHSWNALGSPMYPPGTNVRHLNIYSYLNFEADYAVLNLDV